MGRKWTLGCALLLALTALPWAAQAQRRPGGRWAGFRRYLTVPVAGVRGGYDFDTHSGSVGGDLRIPVVPRGGFLVVPSGDVFFTPGPNDWQLNLDGELRPFPLLGLYGGGGGALIHHAFTPEEGQEAKPGWNLFAGLQPTFAPVRPFVETRWTFRGDHYSAFRLVAGIDIPLLRRHRGGYPPRPPRQPRRPPRY